MSPADHEMLEIRRAFEKYGLAELLVAADGTVSTHIGVLRLLMVVSQHDDLLLELRRAVQTR